MLLFTLVAINFVNSILELYREYKVLRREIALEIRRNHRIHAQVYPIPREPAQEYQD